MLRLCADESAALIHAGVDVQTLSIISQSEDSTTASHQDLLFQFWHHETTSEGIVSFERGLRAISKAFSPGVRVVIIVEPSARLPSKLLRNQIAQMMSRSRRKIRVTALVYEGSGFGAASIRAVVTGLNIVSRHPFPYRVFSSVSSALAWSPMKNSTSESASAATDAIKLVQRFRSMRRKLSVAS